MTQPEFNDFIDNLNKTRFDKELGFNSHDFINFYGKHGYLIRDIAVWICIGYTNKDSFNYYELEIDAFCKLTGNDPTTICQKDPDAINDKWTSKLEHALYLMATKPMHKTKTFKSRKELTVLNILSDVKIKKAQTTGKRKYFYKVEKGFEGKLGNFFFEMQPRLYSQFNPRQRGLFLHVEELRNRHSRNAITEYVKATSSFNDIAELHGSDPNINRRSVKQNMTNNLEKFIEICDQLKLGVSYKWFQSLNGNHDWQIEWNLKAIPQKKKGVKSQSLWYENRQFLDMNAPQLKMIYEFEYIKKLSINEKPVSLEMFIKDRTLCPGIKAGALRYNYRTCIDQDCPLSDDDLLDALGN